MAKTAQKPVNTGSALPKYVGIGEICDALAISRSTLDRDRKDGKFPAHTMIRGRVVWPVDAVRAYVEARAATHIPTVATHNAVGSNVTLPQAPDAKAAAVDFAKLKASQAKKFGLPALPPRQRRSPEETTRHIASLIGFWLSNNGYPECTVSFVDGRSAITWPSGLGYVREDVEAAAASMWNE